MFELLNAIYAVSSYLASPDSRYFLDGHMDTLIEDSFFLLLNFLFNILLLP